MDALWPIGCIKPNSCARHRQCMYAQSPEKCRHFGRDLTDDIGKASQEREWQAAAPPMTAPDPTAPARPVEEALAERMLSRILGAVIGGRSLGAKGREELARITAGDLVAYELAPILADAAETAALREENARLREIVESDHDGKAIAEYEWERANKLAADNAALRQRLAEVEREKAAALGLQNGTADVVRQLEAKVSRLLIAFHDATRRPLGVTPDSGAEFYSPRMAEEAEERRPRAENRSLRDLSQDERDARAAALADARRREVAARSALSTTTTGGADVG